MARRIVRRSVISDINQLDTSIHPVLKRIYSQRSLHTPEELDYRLDRLIPYHSLTDIQIAVELLTDAISQQKSIFVVGDFDADGATSTAIAVRALRAMGAVQLGYLVPDRFRYGYGLTPEISRIAHERGAELIVTVDNGISSLEGVRTARELGMMVLVTDHHLQGETLPDANAIVNPNKRSDPFPSKALAGVGVIFYVMLALRATLRERGWFEKNRIELPNLAQWLDIVALGTVADVVPLDGNNRILVDQGLRRIRAGKSCPGIRALLDVAQRNESKAVADDLAFYVGPRLNAAGRLEDMSIGIECLLTDDLVTARHHAAQLQQLNQERREIEQQMRDEAMQDLSAIHLRENGEIPAGICLFDESWHQGVVGILASRVKEKYHRPTIAFAPTDNDEIKGSARSIEGLHIRDLLDKIATRHPDILNKFGGHAMAAGLSLKKTHYARFSELFAQTVSAEMAHREFEGIIESDGELLANEMNMTVAALLREAGPWGQGFPQPIFDGRFAIEEQRIIGEKHLKLKLKHPQTARSYDAIAFNVMEDEDVVALLEKKNEAQFAYKLDINEFRGRKSLQLQVEAICELDS
ncbi:MAG: single-stranded-DNA-specific exonuclease RecJ [Gammaproteobacteria bacterium]|nr:single-stranded-DNA-specific exonuclease RecJ [Gammaproteobacteria bacterium]MDH5693737.1 single-stranded-DNA-specific exonuclease RecJ [Gammaproteobacteria bacterium]